MPCIKLASGLSKSIGKKSCCRSRAHISFFYKPFARGAGNPGDARRMTRSLKRRSGLQTLATSSRFTARGESRYPESSYRPQTMLKRAAQWILLLSVFLAPVTIMRGKSATFDEVYHLPAGFSYLTTGIIKLNPQHPPLIKEICALPLLFLDIKKDLDREGLENLQMNSSVDWNYGRLFLYSRDA